MRILILSPALLFLASCASAPERQQPKLNFEVPATYSAASQAAGPAHEVWWTAFEDAHLHKLVAEAIANSPTLDAAAARVDRALAQAKIAGADIYPQLSGSFSAARQQQIFQNFGPGGSSLTTRSTNYGASLSTSWELDVWGRIRAGTEASIADIQAQRAAFQGALDSLIAQVIRAYFGAIESQRRLAVAQASYQNVLDLEQSIRSRYTKGLVTRYDLDLTTSQSSRAQAQLGLSKQLADNALRQLEVLLGRYPSASLELAADLPASPGAPAVGVPSDILMQRPDVIQAERLLAAAGRRVDEAEASRYPRFALTASAGTSSDQLKDLVDGDFGIWSLAANLTAPIFQGGRIDGAIEASEATEEEVTANYVRTLLVAFAEVEGSLAAEAFIRERLDATLDRVRNAETARHSAENRYRRGLADIMSLLNARQDAFDAQLELESIRREALVTRVDLMLALGAGFDARRIYDTETPAPDAPGTRTESASE